MVLLTIEDVSAMTGLSPETLAQWRSRKKNIDFVKIGNKIRYDERDVEKFLEGCRVRTRKDDQHNGV
jgi:excisionase family DNA binding protein